MKRGHELSGLMKFANRPEWQGHLQDALNDRIAPVMAQFDLRLDELPEIVGDDWAMILWGCAFEDLATRTFEPDARNLVDEYLKRRGWSEPGPTKIYMRALRSSVLSLYEVSEIDPGKSFLARDLIRGGEPVRISEHSASKSLTLWDKIGARVVLVGGKFLISGGLLPFTPEAADALLTGIRRANANARKNVQIDDQSLREMASAFSNAWLLDVVSRTMGSTVPPVMHNGDGEEVVFHQVRFPFARGITQAKIAARLRTIPFLQQENGHFWNWLGDKPTKRAKKKGENEGAIVWGVTMADGRAVLGNVELKGRVLILAVTSSERAQLGTSLLQKSIGDLVGEPLTEIETIEQARKSRQPDRTRDEVSPEVATPLVHSMLDRHYRETLDEPVGMLRDVSPRKAARSAAGRERVVAWLKYLENMGVKYNNPNDPMATYDFAWLWRELGVEDLRR